MTDSLPRTLDDALAGSADTMSVPHLLAHVKALANDRKAQAKYLRKDPSMRLDEQRLETFLPRDEYPGHWNRATKDAFETEWEQGPSKAEIENLSPKCAQMLTEVWKVVCKVFRCLPTDLLSPRRGRRLLYGGTGSLGSKIGLVGEGESVGRGSTAQPTTVWKPAFGRALMAAVCCQMWENEPEIFVMALQYAIICNTRDKRKWVIGDGEDPTGTDFVKALMRAIDQKDDDETIPEVHHRLLHDEPRLGRSSISKLFKRIESLSAKVKVHRPPSSSNFFWVTQKDLETLEEAANTGFGGRLATGHLTYWYIKKGGGYGLPKQSQLKEYLLRGTRQLLIDVWVSEEDTDGDDEQMQDVDAGESGERSQEGEESQDESDLDESRPEPSAGRRRSPSASLGQPSPQPPARRRRMEVVDDSDAEDRPQRPVRRQRREEVEEVEDEYMEDEDDEYMEDEDEDEEDEDDGNEDDEANGRRLARLRHGWLW